MNKDLRILSRMTSTLPNMAGARIDFSVRLSKPSSMEVIWTTSYAGWLRAWFAQFNSL